MTGQKETNALDSMPSLQRAVERVQAQLPPGISIEIGNESVVFREASLAALRHQRYDSLSELFADREILTRVQRVSDYLQDEFPRAGGINGMVITHQPEAVEQFREAVARLIGESGLDDAQSLADEFRQNPFSIRAASRLDNSGWEGELASLIRRSRNIVQGQYEVACGHYSDDVKFAFGTNPQDVTRELLESSGYDFL